jgi:hypothetical protein
MKIKRELVAGCRIKVVGPIEWLQHIGAHNRLGHEGTLVLDKPADCRVIEGRGMTNIFRVKLDNSMEDMFHHIPGPCLERIG